MNLGQVMNAFAGIMVLASLLLATYHSPNWLWFTAFVGVNLFQSAFTGFCIPAMIFKKFGVKSGSAF